MFLKVNMQVIWDTQTVFSYMNLKQYKHCTNKVVNGVKMMWLFIPATK